MLSDEVKGIKENGEIEFAWTPLVRTIIYFPVNERYKVMGFMKHEVFKGRIDTNELKLYTNVKQITFLFE
jgi:hypothetical protein